MDKLGKRPVVKIDEELCDGCGLCVPSCAEGAIGIVDGKARLVADEYCDGLGACLGECPRGAITMEVRDAAEFDEEAVRQRLKANREEINRDSAVCAGAAKYFVNEETTGEVLTQWPIQLHLVSPGASFLQRPRYLIAADCVAFAYPDFHRDLSEDQALLIGCPKLDDTDMYLQKLVKIFSTHTPEEVTVAIMEVPCCSGFYRLVKTAREESGAGFVLNRDVIGVRGEKK